MAQLTPQGTHDATRFGTLYDVQYDYLGRRLATASEDAVVRVWSSETREVLSELRGHRAPVFTLSWAQGRLATVLASGSADGHVIVWREARPDEWQVAHQINVTGTVGVVGFCPPEYGLVLAVAGLDEVGVLTMLTHRDGMGGAVKATGEEWNVTVYPAHDGGVLALSWAPSTSAATLVTGPAVSRAAGLAHRRLVTGGVDGSMCIWLGDQKTGSWSRQHELSDARHQGRIRDLAWRPNIGLPSSLIASCTDSGLVATWQQDMEGQPWYLRTCWQVDGDARRLSWSRAGTLLALSVGDSSGLLYKEGTDGQWEQVSSIDG